MEKYGFRLVPGIHIHGIDRAILMLNYSDNYLEKETSLENRVSLSELLDRVLNKGAVLTGEISISVANIELLYIGVSLVISSVETLIEAMNKSYTREGQACEIN